jgi:hypothetical protein
MYFAVQRNHKTMARKVETRGDYGRGSRERAPPSACVRQCRPTMSRVIIRRLCTARRVAGGSAMLTPRTRSGIRACCLVVMRAAGHQNSEWSAQPLLSSLTFSNATQRQSGVKPRVSSGIKNFALRSLRAPDETRPIRLIMRAAFDGL